MELRLAKFLNIDVCFGFFSKLSANGRRYDKCGIKMHSIFKPAQIYVKIANLSTNAQPRICYIVCQSAAFTQSSYQLELLAESEFNTITTHRSLLFSSSLHHCPAKVSSEFVKPVKEGVKPGIQQTNRIFEFEKSSIFCLSPGILNAALLTVDAMASAGINCCSTVCQHKCI